MHNLDEKTWSDYRLSNVFQIESGTRLESRNRTPGIRPFIGALDNSNGVVQFVGDSNASLDRNVLGVNYNGNGMGIGFYHPYECVFSDDVKRFHWKGHLDNCELALFVKPLIEAQRNKFGYLYKFNAKRMAATSIELPVTDDGEPDYEYMEQYAASMRKAKLAQYREYVQKRIDALGDYVEIPSLNEKEWKPIALGHIFEMNIASAVDYGTTHSGEHNFIGRQTTNNGLQGFVSEPCVEHGNCLIVGMVGEKLRAFYQQQGFAASQNILVLRNLALNCFNGLFIAGISKLTFQKYGYGRPIGLKRAAQDLIMLPVNDAGEPDFEYMEQYSKNMMLRKYQQYLAFLDTKK